MKTSTVVFFCLCLSGYLLAGDKTDVVFVKNGDRLTFGIPATYLGVRGIDGLAATYGAAAIALVLLYPPCRWYRSVKAAHLRFFLKYT